MKQLINNTALYLRLSHDDENYGDSVSIETQRKLLWQYAKENNLYVVDEYVDDGWSGTNFDRPAFKRMIEDVESGKINCIVTKDLSRFGREHIMVGYYLEFYFVEKNVRYIAVSDNEDTEKGLSDFVPFKNLFNEFYAKDTSRKTKISFRAKFAAGERIFAYAPIGYKKHPEIKNKLAVDEEIKWIIEKIYGYALLGNGAGRIMKMLIEEKIPTPGYLHYKRDGNFANIYAGAPEEKSYSWTISQIKSILKDETYIGNTVHYRESNVSYKNKHRIRKDKSEWLVVENTHEAIISREDFDKVQQMIGNRRRSQKKTKGTQIFAGLVKCADCGWSLGYSINRSVKLSYSSSAADIVSLGKMPVQYISYVMTPCMHMFFRGSDTGQRKLAQIPKSCLKSLRQQVLRNLLRSAERRKLSLRMRRNAGRNLTDFLQGFMRIVYQERSLNTTSICFRVNIRRSRLSLMKR